MDKVEVKLCVITTLTRRGSGTEDSPVRVVVEVWDAETGYKIAENDPWGGGLTSPCAGVV